jgi:hypothetical protein
VGWVLKKLVMMMPGFVRLRTGTCGGFFCGRSNGLTLMSTKGEGFVDYLGDHN